MNCVERKVGDGLGMMIWPLRVKVCSESRACEPFAGVVARVGEMVVGGFLRNAEEAPFNGCFSSAPGKS